MSKFLRYIIEHFSVDHASELSNYCFVFPSRRSCGYFKSHLLHIYKDQNFLLPAIMSIGDFIRSSSPLIIPDDLKLLSLLFECYKKHIPNFNESFEEFYLWGKILLDDFDEIDKYMVNANKVYQTLLDIKQIDALFEMEEEQKVALRLFWQSTQDDKQDDVRQKFLQIWEHLGSIYNSFLEALEVEGMSYEGLVYRSLVNNVEQGKQSFDYEKIVVGGFNALSHSEKRLFKGLIKNYGSFIFWDSDDYYLDDHLQEAGVFLREYQEIFHEKNNVWIKTNMVESNQEIKIVAAPRWTGQAQYCANKLLQQNDLSDTAIVLCDEKLLDPLLNILPKSLGDINITMGYALRNSPIFNLVRAQYRLQKNKRRYKGETAFYHKDVNHIIGNPVLSNILDREKSATIERLLKEENMMVIPASLLADLYLEHNGEMVMLFGDFDEIDSFKTNQLKVLTSIRDYIFTEDPVNSQIDVCDAIIEKINVLFTLIDENDLVDNLSGYNTLLSQHLQSVKIPFSGEGTDALQIMGFLESRTLDFKNLYILSANEGYLPAKQSNNTFIPHNIRRAFDLPTFEQHDNIYAYHFYRLLQRGQNIHLVYDNVISQSQNEKSRFIQQLLSEYPRQIEEMTIQQSIQYISNHQPLTIEKSEAVLLKLSRFLTGEKQLSATAITTYLTCPIQFYFQYVLNLYEDEDNVDEEIDQALFGNIFHHVMEYFYTPYLNTDIPGLLKGLSQPKLESEIEHLIKQAFMENKLGTQYELLQGRNYLIKNVIKKLCERLVAQDKKLDSFRVTGLEQKIENYALKISDNRTVYLKGIIDRIDLLDQKSQSYRIIDYKTGQVNMANKSSYNKLLDDESYIDKYFSGRNKQGFQGYFYALLFEAVQPNAQLQVGFYSTRKLSNGIIYLRDGDIISNELVGVFKEKLKKVIEEILDPNIPFVQTEKSGVYRYSPYRELVNKI